MKYLAVRAMNWFRLEGLIIFKSSEKNYPVERDGDIVFKYNKKNYHVFLITQCLGGRTCILWLGSLLNHKFQN